MFKKQQSFLKNKTNVYDFSLIFPSTHQAVRSILKLTSNSPADNHSPTSSETAGESHYVTVIETSDDLNRDEMLPEHFYKPRSGDKDDYDEDNEVERVLVLEKV
jgi:hypothetical protein